MIVPLPKVSRQVVRRLRGVTTWGVLLAFATIAVPGQGLHLLPGMDHCHGAVGCGAETGQSAHNSTWDVPHGCSLSHADDCAICQFTSLGKTLPARTRMHLLGRDDYVSCHG